MNQDTEKKDNVEPRDKTEPKKKVVKPIEETVSHNIPAFLGIALVASMFIKQFFIMGALMVLLIAWWYIPKSYDRRRIHVKYANISRTGVFISLYAFTLIVGTYLITFVAEMYVDVALQMWSSWMLILIRIALGYCGLLYISLEWGKNISEWLTYKFAPSLAEFSGKGIDSKTKYLKKRDKSKEEPAEEPLVRSSDGRTLSRKDELEQQSGDPEETKKGFEANTSLVGGQ